MQKENLSATLLQVGERPSVNPGAPVGHPGVQSSLGLSKYLMVIHFSILCYVRCGDQTLAGDALFKIRPYLTNVIIGLL